MSRLAGRRLVAVLALLVVGSSCGGGSSVVDVSEIANLAARDVRPPPPVDTQRTGLPGLFIATNSPSLRRLAGAPDEEGAVILFVEPGGPTDGLGVGRGDLITTIGDERVMNHSRALALLHDRPGKEIEVKIRHRDDRERTITIKPRQPLVASLRQYLNPLINASPKDPILRFVRAQTPGPVQLRLSDVEAALAVDKRFTEAWTLGSSLLWDNRPRGRAARETVDQALDGWRRALRIDPNNTYTLTTRSTVLSQLGEERQAERDATKAVDIDPTHPRAHYAEGFAEETLKRVGEAAGPARAAVELDPFNIFHWRLLARVFKALKRENDCRRTASAFTGFLEARNLDDDAATLRALCR